MFRKTWLLPAGFALLLAVLAVGGLLLTGQSTYAKTAAQTTLPGVSVSAKPPMQPAGQPRSESAPAAQGPITRQDVQFPLQEGFEGETLGSFRSSSPVCVPGGCGWRVVSTAARTGVRSAFAPNLGNIADQRMESISAIAVPASPIMARLSFWHRFTFEQDAGGFYDGGVLEVSTDGGTTWTDAGPNITTGGYNVTLSNCCSNPLAGRPAWGGTQATFTQVIVNLMPYAGQSLLFRYRLGTDDSVTSTGWWVDDVQVEIETAATCAVAAWSNATVLPANLMDNAVVSVGGFVYSFGGVLDGTTVTANAYRFDGTTWTAIAPLPAARQAVGIATDGTSIFLYGGWDSAGTVYTTLHRYDTVANTYTALAAGPTGTSATTLSYLNGNLYRVGGCTSNTCATTNTVSVYNITGNTWAAGTAYPTGIAFHSAITSGGYIWVAGGYNGAAETNKTYRFDGTTWDDASIADLPVTRWGAADDLYYGNWIIAGGVTGGALPGTSYRWNPGANTWTAIPNMPAPRYRFGGGTLGTAFYAVGGSSGGFTATNSNQRFLDVPCVGNTPTPSATASNTTTPTITSTPSNTVSPTSTGTATPTPSITVTATATPSATGSATATATGSVTATATEESTATATATEESTVTVTATEESTATVTATGTVIVTGTATATTTTTTGSTIYLPILLK